MFLNRIVVAQGRPKAKLFLDGREALELDRETVQRLNLAPGQELSPSFLQYIRKEDIYSQALRRALKLIRLRPRSEKELRDKIAPLFPQEVLERLIRELTAEGLLDDARVGQAWIDWYLAQRRKSAREIERELFRRGLKKALVKKLLSSIPADEEEKTARQLAKKKMRTAAKLKDRRALYQKVGGYLARKGFAYSAIKKALEKLLIE